MGKGDKKTRRGKLFQGSFGVRRPKKAGSKKDNVAPVISKDQEKKPVKQEVKQQKSVPAKKEPKAKKAGETES